MRTAGLILGILVTLLVLVLWVVISGAIPTEIGLLIHVAAILTAFITGVLASMQGFRQ
jgi:hypothetical protein